MSDATDTIVIGAGPAGLAAGACLGREGVPYLILEKDAEVGSAWRRHYDRLHLHTVKAHSALPYLDYPESYPRYIPRLDFVAYLDDYARKMGVLPHIRFGRRVERARYDAAAGGWEVRTASAEGGAGGGDIAFRAQRLVIATSYNGQPNLPDWPGRERFRGTVVHTAEYRNGKPFAGKDVLVVGIGNSGAEIAIDLVEHGARPSIAVRGPVWVTPRDLLGTPAQITSLLMSKLPIRVADAIVGTVLRFAVGDLSAFGLRRPSEGLYTLAVRKGRIPLIDIGTVALVKSGAIRVVPDVERLTEDGVVFQDGKERRFDAIVIATGFRARLDRFLEGADRFVDDRGYPRWHGREAPVADAPGLHFIGFANPPTGALREIAIEARRVARAVAEARAASRAPSTLAAAGRGAAS